jgi:hypothetical protein
MANSQGEAQYQPAPRWRRAFGLFGASSWMVALFPKALTQGGFQVGRPVMLAQKVAKGFLGQVLEGHHAVAGKQIDGLPRFIVELDPLPGISAPPVDPEEIAPVPA